MAAFLQKSYKNQRKQTVAMGNVTQPHGWLTTQRSTSDPLLSKLKGFVSAIVFTQSLDRIY